MDVAALSMSLSQMNLKQQVSTSVLSMAMDSAKGGMENMSQMLQDSAKAMELSVNPDVGANLDISL